MTLIQDHIQLAVAALQPPPEVFRELELSEAEKILNAIHSGFVSKRDGLYWWENLSSSTSWRIPAGDGWRMIGELVPDANELVWLLAGASPPDLVFEATPHVAQAIIGECPGFEYYLVDKRLRWLLCENHHEFLIGCGDPIEGRLRSRV